MLVPPQKLIQMMRGEANAYDEATQTSLGSVAANRFGDAAFGNPTSWQAAINGDFQGTNSSVTTGVQPELDRAVNLFDGTTGDIVGGAKCFWTPLTSQWNNINAALGSGTTTFPSDTGAPGCWGGQTRQIVVKSSVQQHFQRSAPAFVFLRLRPSGGDPAVVSIP